MPFQLLRCTFKMRTPWCFASTKHTGGYLPTYVHTFDSFLQMTDNLIKYSKVLLLLGRCMNGNLPTDQQPACLLGKHKCTTTELALRFNHQATYTQRGTKAIPDMCLEQHSLRRHPFITNGCNQASNVLKFYCSFLPGWPFRDIKATAPDHGVDQ